MGQMLHGSATTTEAVRQAIQYQFYRGEESEEQQVLNFLRGKEILLVMDNFEHLLEGADLLDRLLVAAANVKILATSREPLASGWECLFEVGGLSVPGVGDTPDSEAYGAVRLFVERARRLQPAFRLSDERPAVTQICRLTGGVPLGIEIAAGWRRLMPVEDVARSILDLEATRRDIPDRQRSLRALFDETWARLTLTQRVVMEKLSLFRRGFTLAAAEAVSGASPAVLASLVNKSLVQRDRENGRYSLHELLAQYAAEQLARAPAEGQSARERHSEFYCTFIADEFERIKKGLRRRVWDDLENVLAAWDWALAHTELARLRWCMISLFWFLRTERLEAQGRRAMSGQAVRLVERVRPSPERDAVAGLLLAMESTFTHDLARKRELAEQSLAFVTSSGDKQAEALAEVTCARVFPPLERERHLRRSVELFANVDDRWGLAYSIHTLGRSLLYNQMRAADALVEAEKAVKLFHELQATEMEGISLSQLGIVLLLEDDSDGAQRCFRAALELTDQYDPPDFRMKASYLNNVAWLQVKYGTYSREAEENARQAVGLNREHGDPNNLFISMTTLGTVKFVQGDYVAASEVFHDCLKIAQGISPAPPPWMSAQVSALLGMVAQQDGRLSEAYQLLASSLELATQHGLGNEAIVAVEVLALTLARDGRKEDAIELLGLLIPRSADKYMFIEMSLRTELEAELGPAAVHAAIERGKDRDLFEAVRQLLDGLARR